MTPSVRHAATIGGWSAGGVVDFAPGGVRQNAELITFNNNRQSGFV